MSIKNKIKHIIKSGPLADLATRLGDIYVDPRSMFLGRLESANNNTALLVGTPAHYNIGDHLIAYNEERFLKDSCKFDSVIELPTRIFLHNIKSVSNRLDVNVPIFITGGGWMGNLWPEDEKIIEQFISTFANHKITILPQTIFYENIDDDKCQRQINKTKNLFSEAKDLTIICRDRLSYEVATKYFSLPNIKISLRPDMGLYICDYSAEEKENSIACCLREDREQIHKGNIVKMIEQFACVRNIRVKKISTMSLKPVSLWKRKFVIERTKKTFGKPQIVVTDRLHGMIFSAIVGTNCIALDNKTHKVKGVYDLWLKNNPAVVLIEGENVEDKLIKELTGMIEYDNKSYQWHDEIQEKFNKMGNELHAKFK